MKNGIKNRSAVDFKLNVPITAAVAGDYGEVDRVTLIGPCSKNRVEASIMKAFYKKVILDGTKSAEEAKESMSKEQLDAVKKKIEEKKKSGSGDGGSGGGTGGGGDFSGEDLLNNMTLIEYDVDKLNAVYDAFKELVSNGGRCLIDEQSETMMTGDLFDDLDLEDMERMACEYAVNFLLSSLIG